ncbi:VIT1/CCC1 transporter family protein [Gordonia sp. X0973]|uniref:VIT1/CCC1 transporter family protein n=1 Tax=Gordonia sp. X0973 TaxID=2742602 RepID=UPI000F530C0D|nr:VIT1/CCC1 transporter family protein [Gordonia sp. X0973]QKT05910.1 VIT1/CCC1 transporter family protein [Gordonia sp. X0973]
MRLPIPRWRDSDPGEIRSWITEVNDGIVAVAGMALGLAGAEVAPRTAYAVITLNAIVGALTVFGAKLGERLADREAEQDLVAKEEARLRMTPDEEKAEIVDWLEARGVGTSTAHQVADDLAAGDALGAQLVIEYGLRETTTVHQAWRDALQAGAAFLIGAVLPLVGSLVTPWEWRVGWLATGTAICLTITSFILSRRGHSNPWATVLRSLVLGLGTLAVSYFAGGLLQ